MKWNQGAILYVGLFVGLLCFHSELHGQTRMGPFEITGLYRLTVNAATGVANPNNTANATNPVSLIDSTGKPDLLLMQNALHLNIYGKLGSNWSVLLEPRFTLDTTKTADDYHEPPYESLPSNFAGHDWLLRSGGRDGKVELSQAYINYASGNLWLRVGKQPIAWGEAIAQRVLDVVNPLDLSQFFFFDRALEEFEGIRIPQWFIRGAVTVPTDQIHDLTFELVLNPGLVTPTILPEQGAPYNVLPGILKATDEVETGEATVGTRVTGTLGDFDFSLNFLSKPNDDGVGVVPAPPGGLVYDPRGIPLLGGLGIFDPFRVDLRLQHPRVNIFGGSLNYFSQDLGALFRVETTVTPNAPFSLTENSTAIVKRRVWKSVIQIERPTYLIPGLGSMSVALGYFFTHTSGDLSQVYSSGAKVDEMVHSFSVLLQQPLFRKQVNLELLAIYDTDDSYWIQPAIHWEIGSNFRLDLLYNAFGGSERRPGRFGSFYWAEGLALRLTMGF